MPGELLECSRGEFAGLSGCAPIHWFIWGIREVSCGYNVRHTEDTACGRVKLLVETCVIIRVRHDDIIASQCRSSLLTLSGYRNWGGGGARPAQVIPSFLQDLVLQRLWKISSVRKFQCMK
jgi:hypothetical protein